jgi:hypothetical protein
MVIVNVCNTYLRYLGKGVIFQRYTFSKQSIWSIYPCTNKLFWCVLENTKMVYRDNKLGCFF